jgi:hypothetical protein
MRSGLIAALAAVIIVAVLTIFLTDEPAEDGTITVRVEMFEFGFSGELYCDIVGHVEAGMVAPLTITEAASAEAVAP